MAVKRVKLSYIYDDTARKVEFERRKKDLIKDVTELNACGIPIWVIITNPFDHKTEIWPDPKGIKHITGSNQNTSAMDKFMAQVSLMKRKIAEAQDQLEKQRQVNLEKLKSLAMLIARKILPPHLYSEDPKDFLRMVEEIVKRLEDKIALG